MLAKLIHCTVVLSQVLASPGFGEDVREIKRSLVADSMDTRSPKLCKITDLLDTALVDDIWTPESKVRGSERNYSSLSCVGGDANTLTKKGSHFL